MVSREEISTFLYEKPEDGVEITQKITDHYITD